MTPAWTALMVCALALLPGCKIVPNPDPTTAEAEAPMDDDQRMAARATQIFDEELPPMFRIVPSARPICARSLRRGWTLQVKRTGSARRQRKPLELHRAGRWCRGRADRESRAATLTLDTDADGQGDLTVQLGPVIRGTALRDALDFLVFTDFRDQIEFAKLARALNDQAHQRLVLPDADLTGRSLSVTGAMTLPAADAPWVVVPTALVAP